MTTRLTPSFLEDNEEYLTEVIEHLSHHGVNALTQEFVYFLSGTVFVAKTQGMDPYILANKIWHGFGLTDDDKTGSVQ